MKYPQVMIDLETMSARSNASICSIGAVKFNQTEIISTFYCTIDIKTCKEVGLHIDMDTVEWWSKQNKEALRELRRNNITLIEALDKFDEWFGSKSLPIWGNGAAFDNVIMDNAYKALGRKIPWSYWDDRCYRTAKAMFDWIPEDARQGVYHNSLDDAMHQTKHLMKILGGE